MFKVESYPHGTFSWSDCNTTDQNAAKDFYMKVMGWSANDVPMGENMVYTMLEQGGISVTAISPMQEEQQKQGVPSHWYSYITVDKVDDLVDKVKELGGTVMMEPFDVFDSGRMMGIQDPTGAMVMLWEAKNHIGAGLVNTPGTMAWNELNTHDLKKAQEFFKELLGWEYQQDGDSGYHMILNNGRPNGGMIQIEESWGEVPPNWQVYFSVKNIEETVDKIKAHGGKMHMDIMDASGSGRFALAEDPTGAHFTVIQLNQPQLWDVN